MEPFDGLPWPSRYNEELGHGGRLGPAEDRGGDISGSGLGVDFLKALESATLRVLALGLDPTPRKG
jgi:hypothetical protein